MRILLVCALAMPVFAAPSVDPAQPVKWQPVTLTFDGPSTSEGANPNPFTDYRMSVTFEHSSGEKRVSQGFFAADGDAANSSAKSGC